MKINCNRKRFPGLLQLPINGLIANYLPEIIFDTNLLTGIE